ncbi:scarecrow-like protein 23 [Phragmites australis]|uniref:scarecrow-like protein 23 n=1 Tax=Phragmites australis TaxID=29695 RepID=UPI002D7942D2|nr:scarecrow-like protein 23 [Phragmites australis]
MNLTLSLGISGGTAKKRKVRDGVVDDVGDGGDRGRVMRLLQARERMMARLEFDDPRAAPDDDGASGGGGLRLMHLLLSSVAAGEAGDAQAAAAALQEVYRHASFGGGDPAQRVAAYFADALASRLFRSPVAASPPTSRTELLLAYTMFYQASPFYQFAHFTANQVIVEAFEDGGRRRLHVVDFDVSYGFQWPSLIQSLSDAAGTSTSSSHEIGDCDERVSLRITGFGTSADELRQTEARLTRFASGCPNLLFEFEGVLNGPNSVRHDRIKTDDATVVVNLVFPAAQNSRTSSREACSALARIDSLNPSLVFLVEKDEGGCSGLTGGNATSRRRSSLLPRFTATLRYFAAVFDSLHECLPADSTERLAIERDHLGREISNAMAPLDRHRGDDHMAAESSGSASWKETMESAGFEVVKLSSRTVSQAKLLLKMKSGCGGGDGGFRVIEGDGGRAMSLGWRDSALLTATGWQRRPRG